ncbi:MAG: hypothetical protein ACTSUE_26435 [Promethearchaeota archaeon]
MESLDVFGEDIVEKFKECIVFNLTALSWTRKNKLTHNRFHRFNIFFVADEVINEDIRDISAILLTKDVRRTIAANKISITGQYILAMERSADVGLYVQLYLEKSRHVKKK